MQTHITKTKNIIIIHSIYLFESGQSPYKYTNTQNTRKKETILKNRNKIEKNFRTPDEQD